MMLLIITGCSLFVMCHFVARLWECSYRLSAQPQILNFTALQMRASCILLCRLLSVDWNCTDYYTSLEIKPIIMYELSDGFTDFFLYLRLFFLSPTLPRRLSFASAVSAHTEDKDKSINKSPIRNTTWISACGISWNLGVRAGRLMINYEDGAVFIAVIFPQRTCLLAPGLKLTLRSSLASQFLSFPSLYHGRWHQVEVAHAKTRLEDG